MSFTRAHFQLDENDPEAIDALMMEHNGWAMTELAIINIVDGMPSNPVLLWGLSLESLVWHSSGWIGRKDRGIRWFKEFTTVHSGADSTGDDASVEIEDKCWLN